MNKGDGGFRKLVAKAPFVIPLYHMLLRARKAPRQHLEFRSDYAAFRNHPQLNESALPLHWHERLPILGEKTAQTAFDAHYVYHTSWAARFLARNRPAVHIDIASSLFFATQVSAFLPVEFYDYRPANLHLSGLNSHRGDLMNLPFADRSVSSLSCMHVVEHIGLGRYGDPIDPIGDVKAMRELQRVVAPGGVLLFVTPIGKPRIRFNAHRIYGYGMVREHFRGMELEEFVLIPDNAIESGLIPDASESVCDQQNYGCGCFAFRQPE